MTRLLLLVSLALLLGLALSVPSVEEESSSDEKKAASKVKHSKEKSGKTAEEVDNHEKHKKHKKDKGHHKQESSSHEVHKKHGDHKKHESHEKHKNHGKDKNNDEKNKPNNKSKKHHRKQSSRTQKNEKDGHEAANATIDKDDIGWEYENTTAVDTRRILYSKSTPKGKRPYMVYLQLTKESAKAHKYRGWLCGGVIVERYYVITSAACVEDAEHFYIVSGTVKFVDSFDYKTDKCVCNHRRKVVWKCIPKNYKFDFQDSIKWSSNDIAIVKVNKAFKFGTVEKGCDFAAESISYNNISRDLEKPGTKGWIAGWGSGSNFREGVYRRQKSVHIPDNAKCLQEARVCIMDNEHCAKKWSQRFRSIIQQYMICTKDIMKRLSEICDKRYANCTDIDDSRRSVISEPTRAEEIDLGRHLQDPNDYTARRANQGGFCENDHGGPLIVKYQSKERVIGVISACKIDPKTHSCHGPFLYTSIFKNRQFISCSIYKDTEETCRRVFRTGITHEEWNVDWSSVKEDDDDRKDDDDDDDDVKKDDNKNDNNDNDRDDDDDDDSKDTLRSKTKDPTNKTTKKISSAESKEKPKHNKEKKIKHAEKKNKTLEKKDGSSSEEKPKSKKGKTPAKEASSDSSSSSDEKKKERRRHNEEVLYESSKDDNVNEPNSGE